jgi:hypothetical protein
MNILDVIIGMCAVFLVLSVVVSAVNEFIADVLSFRSNHLRDSLDNMIGQAKRIELYAHPLIDNLTPPGKLPAYISSETFATALTDVYGISRLAQQDAAAIQAGIAGITDTNPLKPALSALWNSAAGDYTRFKQGLARWFDDAMDRYSGIYKRRVHVIAFVIAVVVTIGANVSAISVFEKLWQDPTVRTAIANAAAPAAQSISVSVDQAAIEARANAVTTVLGSVSLPIGWHCADPTDTRCSAGDFRVWFGWLITIIAASLGAPFWFDVLGNLANVRSAGPKPGKAPAEKT